jgi:hypothetical protein
MDYQIGDVPYRALRASSVPTMPCPIPSATSFYMAVPPLNESPMLSQQRHAAFPSERDLRAERLSSPAAGSGREAQDWVGRGRGSLLLFPRPPTEPGGTVSVLHGSSVGTMRRVRTTGLTPPAPAIVRPLEPCALERAFPTSNDDGHAVPRGLAPRRASRSARPPHVRARGRRATPALPARLGRCWTRRGRASRPRAWTTSPPGAEPLAPAARHGPRGMGLSAGELAPGHAGRAEPRSKRRLPCSAVSACACFLALAGAGQPLPLGSPLHPTPLRWGCRMHYRGAPAAGGRQVQCLVGHSCGKWSVP